MLDLGAWTSSRTVGCWIPPVPMAGAAAASGGVPDELDQKGSRRKRKWIEEEGSGVGV